MDYTYVSEVGDPARIPAFDDVDTALGQNQVRYAIVNRLLARPAGGATGSAQEVASLEIAQTYAFTLPQSLLPTTAVGEPTTRKEGPVEAILRVASGSLFHMDGRLAYDTFDSQLTSASITAGAAWKLNNINVSWFGSRPVLSTPLPPGSASPNSDQVQVSGGVDLGSSFRLDTSVSYDARQRLFQEDRSLLTYKGSCYTVFLEVRELRLPPAPRRDYRIVVNLKDIGTLLDVNGSLDALLGR